MIIDKVDQVLLEVGVSPHLRGYKYLKSALSRLLGSPGTIHQMGNLYKEIAVEYGTKEPCVERCMRYAIESTFNGKDNSGLHKYLGNTINLYTGKVSNSTFLSVIALYLGGNSNG